jgi:hypothetical protein
MSFRMAEGQQPQQNNHWQGGNQRGEAEAARYWCINLSPIHNFRSQ